MPARGEEISFLTFISSLDLMNFFRRIFVPAEYSIDCTSKHPFLLVLVVHINKVGISPLAQTQSPYFPPKEEKNPYWSAVVISNSLNTYLSSPPFQPNSSPSSISITALNPTTQPSIYSFEARGSHHFLSSSSSSFNRLMNWDGPWKLLNQRYLSTVLSPLRPSLHSL